MPERFPPFDADNLSAEARAVYDRILAERGYVPGPYRFWLASPGFADRIEPVEEYLRHGVTVDERLVEIAVLVVAKHWRAQYVWTSHGPAAEKAYPGTKPPAMPGAVAASYSVENLSAAADFLTNEGVAFQTLRNRLRVPADRAEGCIVDFVPA